MTAMPELGMSVLPGSVLAAHLQASAAGLAEGTTPRYVAACVGSPEELAAVLEHLLASQRHLSDALVRLAGHVGDSVLSEVLTASAEAAGYTAEALAESIPFVQVDRDVTGGDTRL
jgi:hypothetical protein